MAESSNNENIIIRGSRWVERVIIKTLIVLMTLVLIVATLKLAYEFAVTIVLTPDLAQLPNLFYFFGTFLMVLIGVELLDTVKVYLKEHVMHVEVVILVAIMAVARKVIVMDFEKMSGLEFAGIGGLLVALAVGYYLVRKAGGCDFGQESDLKNGLNKTLDNLLPEPGSTEKSQKQSPCKGNQ